MSTRTCDGPWSLPLASPLSRRVVLHVHWRTRRGLAFAPCRPLPLLAPPTPHRLRWMGEEAAADEAARAADYRKHTKRRLLQLHGGSGDPACLHALARARLHCRLPPPPPTHLVVGAMGACGACSCMPLTLGGDVEEDASDESTALETMRQQVAIVHGVTHDATPQCPPALLALIVTPSALTASCSSLRCSGVMGVVRVCRRWSNACEPSQRASAEPLPSPRPPRRGSSRSLERSSGNSRNDNSILRCLNFHFTLFKSS